MEVSSESNIDGGSGSEQNAAGNENNNNGNTRKLMTWYINASYVSRKTTLRRCVFSVLQAGQMYFRSAQVRRHILCETLCKLLPDIWCMVASLPRL